MMRLYFCKVVVKDNAADDVRAGEFILAQEIAESPSGFKPLGSTSVIKAPASVPTTERAPPAAKAGAR